MGQPPTYLTHHPACPIHMRFVLPYTCFVRITLITHRTDVTLPGQKTVAQRRLGSLLYLLAEGAWKAS